MKVLKQVNVNVKVNFNVKVSVKVKVKVKVEITPCWEINVGESCLSISNLS